MPQKNTFDWMRQQLNGGDTRTQNRERDGLRVDAVAFGERPQALLTILYCSTDRLRRCGAPV